MDLERQFEKEEYFTAIKSMNGDSALGVIGFSLAFL